MCCPPPPSDVSWFINPMNCSYKYNKPQLLDLCSPTQLSRGHQALGGPTLQDMQETHFYLFWDYHMAIFGYLNRMTSSLLGHLVVHPTQQVITCYNCPAQNMSLNKVQCPLLTGMTYITHTQLYHVIYDTMLYHP